MSSDAARPAGDHLIEKAQQGDREAFGELVRLHFQGVVNVVYRLSGDVHLAEDIAQETFIRVWSKLHTYRPVGSFRGWVYRIATNAALDALRRRKDDLSMEGLSIPAKGTHVEHAIMRQEQAERVQQAILGLPDASRAVLVLREYEGFSYQEIAESLEIPLGTVMSRLAYAREVLKKRLLRQLEEV